MKTRIISGVALILFMATIIVFNTVFPISLNIAIAVVSAVCVYELIKVVGLINHWEFLFPSLIIASIIPFTNALVDATFFFYALYSLAIFVAFIFHHKTVTFKDLSIVYTMSVLIPSALQTIVRTRALSDDHGMFYAMIAVLAAWIPDVGAYFAGTFFGKHKLCPDISPKKTVEGFIGGIFLSVLVMSLIGLYFTYGFYGGTKNANLLALALVGLGSGFISVVGDLSFSLIKRSCGVKDFGNVIPGHGGFLDRFDSVIFTAPFVFIILSYIPAVI